jgi:hypothetical protein
MTMNLDRNFFAQTGLDSGALTMLGAIIHSFGEPGEYRGVVRRTADPEAAFYVSADKNSPIAQVNVDLATLAQPSNASAKCCGPAEKNRFVVNPKGYVLFHVSGGEGGYSVHIRKAEEAANTKVYDSRELEEGDVFSAIIIRPGTYSVTNLLTNAKGEIRVSYPKLGETAYHPPAPRVVECTAGVLEPNQIALSPGQGLNFQIKARSRIKIELVKPDDGPKRAPKPVARGWKKTTLSAD